MVKVNIVLLNFLQLAYRNQSVYKQCVEFVWSIEIIGLALVGSIGDVFLCQFLDGSEDCNTKISEKSDTTKILGNKKLPRTL